MIFKLMAVLNEFERDQVAERTSAALQHKKAQGRVYSPVPYGYERRGDTLVPVEAEQKVLKLMRSLRSQGRSYAWIARHLTGRGIPTKTGGAVACSDGAGDGEEVGRRKGNRGRVPPDYRSRRIKVSKNQSTRRSFYRERTAKARKK